MNIVDNIKKIILILNIIKLHLINIQIKLIINILINKIKNKLI
jgi:hypothetical protein